MKQAVVGSTRRSVLHEGVFLPLVRVCRLREAGLRDQAGRSGSVTEDPPGPLGAQRAHSRPPTGPWPALHRVAWRPRVGEGSWVADTPQWLSAVADTPRTG